MDGDGPPRGHGTAHGLGGKGKGQLLQLVRLRFAESEGSHQRERLHRVRRRGGRLPRLVALPTAAVRAIDRRSRTPQEATCLLGDRVQDFREGPLGVEYRKHLTQAFGNLSTQLSFSSSLLLPLAGDVSGRLGHPQRCLRAPERADIGCDAQHRLHTCVGAHLGNVAHAVVGGGLISLTIGGGDVKRARLTGRKDLPQGTRPRCVECLGQAQLGVRLADTLVGRNAQDCPGVGTDVQLTQRAVKARDDVGRMLHQGAVLPLLLSQPLLELAACGDVLHDHHRPSDLPCGVTHRSG